MSPVSPEDVASHIVLALSRYTTLSQDAATLAPVNVALIAALTRYLYQYWE